LRGEFASSQYSLGSAIGVVMLLIAAVVAFPLY
jgi:hypothetical protein